MKRKPNHETQKAIRQFCATMIEQNDRLKKEGCTAEEILSIGRNYFIGVIDGIDQCIGRPRPKKAPQKKETV